VGKAFEGLGARQRIPSRTVVVEAVVMLGLRALGMVAWSNSAADWISTAAAAAAAAAACCRL
jgi:hypothetical protein